MGVDSGPSLYDVPINGGGKLSNVLLFVTVGILSEIFTQGNSIEKLLLNSVIVNWSFKHL